MTVQSEKCEPSGGVSLDDCRHHTKAAEMRGVKRTQAAGVLSADTQAVCPDSKEDCKMTNPRETKSGGGLGGAFR